jgi:peroxiredoxin
MKRQLEIGDSAPDFSLIGTDGLIYGMNQFKGYRATVIFFTANLCPFCRSFDAYLKEIYQEFHKKGVAFVGINSSNEGKDTFEQMHTLKLEHGLPWHYLHDRSMQIARRYGAIATPEFFLFDSHRHLVYRGRALANPKLSKNSQREDLKEALQEILDLRPVSISETNPVGLAMKGEGLDSLKENVAFAEIS